MGIKQIIISSQIDSILFLTITIVESWQSYRVYEAVPQNTAQVEALSNLELSESFDFWTTVRLNGSTDIMSPPEQVGELLDFLKSHSIQYKQKIEDVQQ